jgi:hypothetical protein
VLACSSFRKISIRVEDAKKAAWSAGGVSKVFVLEYGGHLLKCLVVSIQPGRALLAVPGRIWELTAGPPDEDEEEDSVWGKVVRRVTQDGKSGTVLLDENVEVVRWEKARVALPSPEMS